MENLFSVPDDVGRDEDAVGPSSSSVLGSPKGGAKGGKGGKREDNVEKRKGSRGRDVWKREEKGRVTAVENSSGWDGSNVENPDAKVQGVRT